MPKWMLRECGLYSTQFMMGFGMQKPDGEMDRITEPMRPSSFYTMNVCELCNNTWMSQLESRVKPLLLPFMQMDWPKDDRTLLQALFLHSAEIARWLLKTACTFGEKASINVPADIRQSLYQGCIPVDINADLAYAKEPALVMSVSREWNVWKDEKLAIMHVEKRSFRMTWQIRHLVLRICYFPHCEMNMLRPRFPVMLYPSFKVPTQDSEGKLVSDCYHYEDLA